MRCGSGISSCTGIDWVGQAKQLLSVDSPYAEAVAPVMDNLNSIPSPYEAFEPEES
ncbi:hypothetical protein OG216_45385 [Streptomycetaceae bacterium NBC_01309]